MLAFKQKNLIKHIVPVTGEVINQCKQVEGETSLFEYKFLNFHQVNLILKINFFLFYLIIFFYLDLFSWYYSKCYKESQ